LHNKTSFALNQNLTLKIDHPTYVFNPNENWSFASNPTITIPHNGWYFITATQEGTVGGAIIVGDVNFYLHPNRSKVYQSVMYLSQGTEVKKANTESGSNITGSVRGLMP
jgi:hypothetical protein